MGNAPLSPLGKQVCGEPTINKSTGYVCSSVWTTISHQNQPKRSLAYGPIQHEIKYLLTNPVTYRKNKEPIAQQDVII